MSWFNRKPRPKNPPVLIPKHSSPVSEKRLNKTKEAVREKNKDTDNKIVT
jgi:hypothetical protein